MSLPAKPRQAASLILLRAAKPGGFEVLLTRRPDRMASLGGMYGYPGGAVTADDLSQRVLRRCTGMAPERARKVIGAPFNERQAVAFWVAAIRELFEETGVLLAAEGAGERLTPARLETLRLPEKHRSLIEHASSFIELLETGDLYCDLRRAGYFSHWQTPSRHPVRFDTRFFVAALPPPEQSALATSFEVAESVWVTPERAMQLCERRELPMIFPTFASLRTLADFETLESVLKEFGADR